MKYLVIVSYFEFLFTDAREAMTFAQIARHHYICDDEREVTVEIRLIDKEEKDEQSV